MTAYALAQDDSVQRRGGGGLVERAERLSRCGPRSKFDGFFNPA
jgi:hypothetical protein